MENTLYNLLKNNTAVAAIVTTRIYPAGTVLQDTSKPYVFFKIDRYPSHDASGAITLTRHETEIHCIAATLKASIDLMKAVSDALIASGLDVTIESIESEIWSEGLGREYSNEGVMKDFKQVMYINIYA